MLRVSAADSIIGPKQNDATVQLAAGEEREGLIADARVSAQRQARQPTEGGLRRRVYSGRSHEENDHKDAGAKGRRRVVCCLR